MPSGTNCAPPHSMIRTVFVNDAAELLGVSRRTVYYRIRDGKLRTVRTMCGSQRVLVDSIEEMLREAALAACKVAATETISSVDACSLQS
jgi:excisionase family DNA binding protein